MTYDERTFWLQAEDSFSGQKVRSALSDMSFFVVLVAAVAGFWLWGPKISVVLSQSMNPTYTAGDALLVVPWGTPHIGDIVQFTVELAPGQAQTTAPVTHRIIGQDEQGFITKGDNPKSTPDAWRVTPDKIEGKVLFWMPQVWMFRIAAGLIGVAVLMFLWPAKREEEAAPENPQESGANLMIIPAWPQTNRSTPQGPPFALPPPNGLLTKPVALPHHAPPGQEVM